VMVKVMLPPAGMDPGELSQGQAQQAFERAALIKTKIKWDDITS